MTHPNKNVSEIKAVIDALIQTATTYDTQTLDRIYHADLKVYMVDPSGATTIADKAAFQKIFAEKKKAGDPPMDDWAEFHHIEASDDNALVILSRKNNLSGQTMRLSLSIDLVRHDNQWQVIREVIFLKPDA